MINFPRARSLLPGAMAFLLFLPLLIPFASLNPDAFEIWQDSSRLLTLFGKTFSLALGSCLLAVPIGAFLAVVLYRTDLFGRRLFRQLALLGLFIPLPILVAGWQWVDFMPLSSMLLYALASIPWVIFLIGQSLIRVERDLEETALLSRGPWATLWKVTFPRCRGALLVSGVWVMLQVFTDMTITDLMQTSTIAEEIYLQFTRPVAGQQSMQLSQILARVTALSLPLMILTACLLFFVLRSWSLYPAMSTSAPLLFPLRRGRLLWTIQFAALSLFLFATPLVSLIDRAGQDQSLGSRMRQAIDLEGWAILRHLGVAFLIGLLTTGVALLLCWRANESRRFRFFVLALMIVAWTLPGPLVGLAWKQGAHLLLDLCDWEWLAILLHNGPSAFPVVHVQMIRLLPFALALLWPVIRQLPPELLESARVDGASASKELRWVVWPWMRRAFLMSMLIVMALSLGELSASKLVSTPGMGTFAEDLFAQMHYRLGPALAARSLLLLALVAGPVSFVLWMINREPQS